MATIESQIISSNHVICSNIESLSDHRSLLSQNILSQLRNLIEGIVVLFHNNDLKQEFQYNKVNPALDFIKSKAKLNFLARFHKLIQKSASHYTLDGDTSERLMLKYYEYLLRTRNILNEQLGLSILENLERFPIDLDPSLKEYHECISDKINKLSTTNTITLKPERYYIHKTKPFFCAGQIYYEVTFFRAVNKSNKSDRVIAFTNIDITDKYAATLTLQHESIEVIGYIMPILIIRDWQVSIRPCEFDNFAKLFNIDTAVRADTQEYRFLMGYLTNNSSSLLDLLDMSDQLYTSLRESSTKNSTSPKIFSVLDKARELVRNKSSGHNIIRYLMLRMFNKTLKSQYCYQECNRLSNLRIKYGCIPFDQMPFCTSLPSHNPRYSDLIECLELVDREHELLARRIKNNSEHKGVLYTEASELESFGDINNLINTYNNSLYYKHLEKRKIVLDKGHAFIHGYEVETSDIIRKLQNKSSSGIQGYTQAVELWLSQTNLQIDDPLKVDALKKLFSNSCVALIYGAAGTGKSTMVDHIAHYFNDKQKLFLAHTNPAIDNLKRKVNAQNSTFKTISSHNHSHNEMNYDVLIIDECSTVSNTDFLNILNSTSFKLLILVGDIYQIESIQFGNWFNAISSFIPKSSIFELKTPYRATNDSLLRFWSKVRNLEDDITECLAQNGYSALLSSELFKSNSLDEIVLCLNYDGLYGINNINRFMQSSNLNPGYSWKESTFKVGDPILFSETERFRPVIFNNLKGKIISIQQSPGWIQFDVWLDRPVSEFDVMDIDELEWVKDSIVRFTVYDLPSSSDEDDDSHNTTIPFQVAYAVSIHKAQGLEYDSVKVVITDSNEDDISHSILYTAVTRSRMHLKIFWTPETQENVLRKLQPKNNSKDVYLLKSRCRLNALS